MKNKDTRKDKIKILQAIKEGKLSIESLLPPQTYLFMENRQKPGYYTMNNEDYSEQKYKEFCERIRRKKNNAIDLTGIKKDLIITINYSRNCEPLKEMQIPVNYKPR